MKAFTNIDELKSAWAKQSGASLKQKLSATEIEAITRQKSKSELEIIKRKFIIESLISVPFLILILVGVNIWGNSFEALVFNTLMASALIILSIPALNFLRVGKLKSQATSVFLNKAVPTIKQVIRAIQIISTVLFPISFVCGFIIGIVRASGKTELADICDILCSYIAMGVGLFFLILSSFGGYYFVKYYYKLIYKKNVDNLEQLMLELNETEPTE